MMPSSTWYSYQSWIFLLSLLELPKELVEGLERSHSVCGLLPGSWSPLSSGSGRMFLCLLLGSKELSFTGYANARKRKTRNATQFWQRSDVHKLDLRYFLSGSTAERVCLAGDSAGGNLCITVSMKAMSHGVRIPDGIMAAYPATLLTTDASPSRFLTLIDPVLPLSVLYKCVDAYTGKTTITSYLSGSWS